MNIDVLSFKRLAYRVFDELGITNLTVLEETGKNLVLRKLAAQEADKLGVIGRNLNRIGYISEVKSLLSELVQYNISPEELGRYIASGRLSDTLSDKLKDVLVLYEAFEKFMQDKYITAEEILNVLSNVAEGVWPFLEIQSLHLMNLLDLHLYRTSSSKSSLSFQRKYM